MTTKKRGRLIYIEGPDGAGKTELVKALEARYLTRLQPGQLCMMRCQAFPSNGPVGRFIRQVLHGEAAVNPPTLLYLYAADAIDNAGQIMLWLEDGCDVLLDRAPTGPSTWAYQTDTWPITDVLRVTNSPLQPDFVFILDVPPDVASARIRQREQQINMFDQKMLDYDRYNEVRQRYAAYHVMCGGIGLDGQRPTEELADEVEQYLALDAQSQETTNG